jgi:diguanylate cyclase (GGDEF)-like protein
VILDLRTMYVVVSMTCVVLGLMQLAAYATRRFERWPGWYGLSNVLVGLGTFGIALRGSVPDFVTIDLANPVTSAGYLLLVISVRLFAGRPLVWWPYALVLVLTTAPVLLFWRDPADYLARIAFESAVSAAFDLLVIREGLRLARREHLASAWIVVGLFCLTAAVFTVRTVLAISGHLNGPEIFSPGDGPYLWMAATANVFVTLRGIALLLMGAERNDKLLLALAQQDPLTGAMNRTGLRLTAERLAAPRPDRGSTAVSVLVIDLDHFKAINDTHGHKAGDAVLCLFASVARSELRGHDILARQGGDEFVVVLPQVRLDDAIPVAERIRRAFAVAPLGFAHPGARPTLSIGVAEGDAAADGLEAILHQADEALYRSKRQGRNRVSGVAAL